MAVFEAHSHKLFSKEPDKSINHHEHQVRRTTIGTNHFLGVNASLRSTMCMDEYVRCHEANCEGVMCVRRSARAGRIALPTGPSPRSIRAPALDIRFLSPTCLAKC
jgi:hypothetical protein